MIAILGGFGAAVAWAVSTLCSSRSSRLIEPFSVVAWVMVVGLLITAPQAAAGGVPARIDGSAGAWLTVAGAGNVIGLSLAYAALRIGQVALVAPVVSTEGAIAALIAVLTGESLTPAVGGTLAVIALGVCLASVPAVNLPVDQRAAHPKVALLAVSAAVAFGTGLYATARAGSALPTAWVVLSARLIGCVAVALPLALTGRLRLTTRALPLVLTAGVCEVLGFYAYTTGARHGIAIAAVVSSQFAALSALGAYVLFKERLSRVQPLPSNLIGGHGAFFTGLGAGLIIAIYDYAGYNTTAYMGAELKNPGRVMPRSIIYSIMAIMALYLSLQIGVLGALPVHAIIGSSSVASLVVTRNWSHAAADVVTAFILVAAFASVFAGLLGGSRVPYHAAEDKTFFRIFGRLHPKYEFPYVALLAMGVVCAIGTFFNLATVIGMLVAVSVLLQSVAQIVAVTVLRRRQPDLRRPYRQWLYPLPSLLALAGWIYVFVSATSTSLILSTVWVLAGVVSFVIWARVNRAWPFGPLEVREQYLQEQRAEQTEPAQVAQDAVSA